MKSSTKEIKCPEQGHTIWRKASFQKAGLRSPHVFCAFHSFRIAWNPIGVG